MDIFAKYGKHQHVKAATVYANMCSRIMPKLAKLGCEFLPNLASIMKNQNPLCKLVCRNIKYVVDIFAKYGKHQHVKTATAHGKMCSRS